ncbi:hypothetical protein TRFO_30570 [Tritrichomonas foetus]|uniref:Vps16 N-terminal domain-containing protein n=1 Tax=Tritrichomonas foetus TaxID=1144522 RepID=A0A1J4JYM6_9EUKA|nr:hypothetical protein TRFO_30570 [Tritrichomonas foetus]|eukprot:OHT02373.1 hypothetical protein TRFO_30570 [Tritrichomonas foetus]
MKDNLIPKNIVDEIHILNDSTFVSESLIQPPLTSSSIFSKNINFEFDVVRAAPYGGSFAVLHSSYSENITKIISLYDPSLNFIKNIELTESLQDFYLTADEMLVVVYNTPSIAVYDQRGHQILYKLLSDQQEFIVASAFWEHGIFIATFAGNVYHVFDFSKLIITKYATDEKNVPNITYGVVLPPKAGSHGPIFWGVIPSESDENQSCIVCVQKNNIKVIEYGEKVLSIQYCGDFSMSMVQTPNSVDVCDEYLRCVNARLLTNDLGVRKACWCGNSTILIVTNDGLKMIGQSTQPIKFQITSECFPFTDVDGARVVTKSNITYIREASDVPLDFIKKNMKSPAIKLFATVSVPEDFAKSDPLETLRDVMDQAINGLLEASTFFRKPSFIKQLLGIVTRYKGECKNYNSEKYLNVISNYRVISQLAESPVNMPLTVAQLSNLGNERLLVRLCNRYLHFIANRVAEYLNMQTEIVGTHWAHCLIYSHSKNDEILKKLKLMESNIDRVELATCSFELASKLDDFELSMEKEKLALALLKSVPAKSRTVPLLIKRGEWSDAVEAAVDSNDSSLLVYVLKSATEQNQDSIVRDCITKHLIALDGWLQLHPDEPKRAELLEKSGLLRESLFFRFKQGQPIETLISKAKECGASLDLEYFQAVAILKQACREYAIDYQPGLTAYDIFDLIIEKQQPKLLKPAAKMLRLQQDEVITRRIEIAQKLGKNEMIEEAAKNASQEILYHTFMNLMDDGKRDIALIINKFIKEDDYMTPRINQRLSE